MPQKCLEQGFVRAVNCSNSTPAKRQPYHLSETCATGQATASFGGDTEVALAISADGPTDLRLSEKRLQGGSKEDVHLYE